MASDEIVFKLKKGIILFYGACSVMLDDGMPSTINHHLPESPEGK